MKALNQPTLPGIEQALCKCGCKQYFMRGTQGRKKEYINPTHKKRAARARDRSRRTESTVTLTPKGWLYYNTHDLGALEELWAGFTETERDIIQMMCDTGRDPNDILSAAEKLFSEVQA